MGTGQVKFQKYHRWAYDYSKKVDPEDDDSDFYTERLYPTDNTTLLRRRAVFKKKISIKTLQSLGTFFLFKVTKLDHQFYYLCEMNEHLNPENENFSKKI